MTGYGPVPPVLEMRHRPALPDYSSGDTPRSEMPSDLEEEYPSRLFDIRQVIRMPAGIHIRGSRIIPHPHDGTPLLRRAVTIRGHFNLRLPIFVHTFGRKRKKIGRMFWMEAISGPDWPDSPGSPAKNRPVQTGYRCKSRVLSWGCWYAGSEDLPPGAPGSGNATGSPAPPPRTHTIPAHVADTEGAWIN